MNHRLYLLSLANFYDQLHDEHLRQCVIPLPNTLRFPEGWLKKYLHALLVGRLPLPRRLLEWWFTRPVLQRLTEARPGDSILLIEVYNLRVLRALRPYLHPDVPCYIYLWNPATATFRHPQETIDAIHALGYRVTTFDPGDARRYDMEYRGQFITLPEPSAPVEPVTDFFFCGRPKSRTGVLEALEQSLTARGFVCDFIIPRSSADYITGEEYIRRLRRTRCVIDVNQEGQIGLSRRPLEALFFEKKMLTLHPTIREYDFYCPENIFIFGEDDNERLSDFLHTPLREIPENIRQQYELHHWLKQFIQA